MRRYLVGSAALALVATGATVLGPSTAVAAAGKGDALVAGVLEASDGSPLAGQAVKVYAWPGEKYLEKMKEGQSAKFILIGSAKTDKAGLFTVKRNARRLPTNAPVFDATVVAAGAGGITSTFDTSFETVGKAKKVRVVPSLVRDPSDTTEVVPGSKPAKAAQPSGALVSTTTVATQEAAAPSGAQSAVGEMQASSSGVPFLRLKSFPRSATLEARVGRTQAPKPCADGARTKLLKKHKHHKTVVSSIHAKTDGHVSKFVLSKGSDARLGGALKMGKSWSVGAVVSRSLQSQTRWGARKKAGNWNLRTNYTMGTYENTLSEYGVCSRWQSFKAISHEGGAHAVKGTAPKAEKCLAYEKGSGIVLNESRATQYAGGLSVEKVVGFDLTSTAGFSKSELIDVQITKKRRKICGTNKYPAEHPTRVMVKKAKK